MAKLISTKLQNNLETTTVNLTTTNNVLFIVANVMITLDFRILSVLCEKVRLAPDLDLRQLAQLTPGYVGVDLRFLVTKAGQICIKRSVHSPYSLMPVGSILSCLFCIPARIDALIYFVSLAGFCVESLPSVAEYSDDNQQHQSVEWTAATIHKSLLLVTLLCWSK